MKTPQRINAEILDLLIARDRGDELDRFKAKLDRFRYWAEAHPTAEVRQAESLLLRVLGPKPAEKC